MPESVNLDGIFEILVVFRKRLETAENRVEVLEGLLQERAAQQQQQSERLISGMQLELRKGATLIEAVSEAVRIFNSITDQHTEQVESLQMELREHKATIGILQADQASVIDKITKALELKKNPHRTLDNAAVEALTLINESKRIIREHL